MGGGGIPAGMTTPALRVTPPFIPLLGGVARRRRDGVVI